MYKAKAVYPVEAQNKMNSFVVFKQKASGLDRACLRICAADFYQVWLNGEFVCFGPARTAKGYAREDVISLEKLGKSGENEIVILVVGYNCNSLTAVKQTPFLMAEVIRDGQPILWTGEHFDCAVSELKRQKTERYSVQRHFCEAWDFGREGEFVSARAVEIADAPTVIDRRAPYARYDDVLLDAYVSAGELCEDPEAQSRRNFYSFLPSERWGRFEYGEAEYHSYEWIHSRKQRRLGGDGELPRLLSENEYAIFDFSKIETGFVLLGASALEDTHVIIAFSEDASADRFEFTDMHAHNVIDIRLAAGQKRDFMSFEPYVMRYAMVAVKSGALRLESFGIKTYENDTSSAYVPDIDDEALRKIYEGAIRTFAHNSQDLYMDCPSRERAGWLCDSYFTAKSEYALFGSSRVEEAFLENYRLFKNNGEYPKGVIPMCYPSEARDDGKFIPQWTMWYILELEEYLNTRNHAEQKELFRESVFGLLDFYARYENSDGLLEDLPSWNFVEWSRANQWTSGVNYPTNFLYAQVLESAYKIYGDEQLLKKAGRVRSVAVDQSFDGHLFFDQAIRDEKGILKLRSNCSETCQYYAVLFGGVDIFADRYAGLREMILTVFGANRTVLLDKIEPINAFIGAYLRLETLLRMKEYEMALRDVRELFGSMTEQTGTLWEYRQRHGSRDHGFASYAAVVIKTALEELSAK